MTLPANAVTGNPLSMFAGSSPKGGDALSSASSGTYGTANFGAISQENSGMFWIFALGIVAIGGLLVWKKI